VNVPPEISVEGILNKKGKEYKAGRSGQ